MSRAHASLLLLLLGVGCSGDSQSNQGTLLDGPITSEDDSLYKRLGGIDVLRVLVDEWLLVASSDTRIRDTFAEADITQLKLRLVERICVAVQGPCLYRGRDLGETHAHMNLSDTAFRAFLDALDSAIARTGISAKPAEELRTTVRGLAEELAVAGH